MNYLGIDYSVKNMPALDPGFIPFGIWAKAYLQEADRPFRIAVERDHGKITVYETRLRGEAFAAANIRFAERLVKMLLWSAGGFRIYLQGDDTIAVQIRTLTVPAAHGNLTRASSLICLSALWRSSSALRTIFPPPMSSPSTSAVTQTAAASALTRAALTARSLPSSTARPSTQRRSSGTRKPAPTPQYQFDGIVTAFQTAASKMPRVDGIGVSSAGTFVGNAPMVSSLFIKVPRERREEVKTIYDRAAKEIGDVPIVVANDGDVTALAGYMSLGTGCVMGLAMGTSEAVGYVDAEGNILGWFNELAFAPVDLNEHAMRDEWSGDLGVGCKYFSQDAVAKLAPAAGIALSEHLTPAEKLKEVQKLAEGGNPYALAIFDSIGVYLAHTLSLYEMFYDIRNLLVLGRVASGIGGERIVSECQRVLNEEYPELSRKLRVMLPDENFRRVGQSMAAASLPDIR